MLILRHGPFRRVKPLGKVKTIDKRLRCFFLPHDLFPQAFLEVARCRTPVFGVQFVSLGLLYRCDHKCSFYWPSSSHRDSLLVYFSELSLDSLSNHSPLIHSRMYGGQFLICTSAPHLAKKMTACRSTNVRFFKSRTIRRSFDSASNSLSNSPTLSASIRPLSLKSTSPFATVLVILSIRPPIGNSSIWHSVIATTVPTPNY